MDAIVFPMPRGKFLVLEGIDGCGKGTQLKLLVKYLESNGKKVYVTEEPSKLGLRRQIKEALANHNINSGAMDALLFAADRELHCEAEIVPNLRTHDFVISDRYYHSSYAYQVVQGMDRKWMMEINKHATKPDLTVIFDLPAEIGLKRVQQDTTRTSKDKFERADFLEKVRKSYLELPTILNETIMIIDANRSVETIFEDVKRAVHALGV